MGRDFSRRGRSTHRRPSSSEDEEILNLLRRTARRSRLPSRDDRRRRDRARRSRSPSRDDRRRRDRARRSRSPSRSDRRRRDRTRSPSYRRRISPARIEEQARLLQAYQAGKRVGGQKTGKPVPTGKGKPALSQGNVKQKRDSKPKLATNPWAGLSDADRLYVTGHPRYDGNHTPRENLKYLRSWDARRTRRTVKQEVGGQERVPEVPQAPAQTPPVPVPGGLFSGAQAEPATTSTGGLFGPRPQSTMADTSRLGTGLGNPQTNTGLPTFGLPTWRRQQEAPPRLPGSPLFGAQSVNQPVMRPAELSSVKSEDDSDLEEFFGVR
ncbi:MAG: hypothetical protein Q9170_006134 [Blastenia crenularia]